MVLDFRIADYYTNIKLFNAVFEQARRKHGVSGMILIVQEDLWEGDGRKNGRIVEVKGEKLAEGCVEGYNTLCLW